MVDIFFGWGCLGLLMEVFFTGMWSLIERNWRATSTTYLWMLPIYGLGALQLAGIHGLHWHPLLMATLYVPVIYLNELVWGWCLYKLTGKHIWDYGHGKRTLLGIAKGAPGEDGIRRYIQPLYAPFWLLAGLGFELFFEPLNKIFMVIHAVL